MSVRIMTAAPMPDWHNIMRLTDEQVDEVIKFMSDPIVQDIPWSPIVLSLAEEVKESRKHGREGA